MCKTVMPLFLILVLKVALKNCCKKTWLSVRKTETISKSRNNYASYNKRLPFDPICFICPSLCM